MGRMSESVIDTYTNGVKSQSVTQQYFYDSNGIKIKQIEKIDANADGIVDGESVTNYLVDALNHTGYAQVLEESRFENGQLVKVITYTIGHDVLAQFDAVNGYLALLADGHGSTRAVADLTGQIIQEYSYDAYGNAHGFIAKDALTNLLYSGEQFNPVSSLQYLRARCYNPQSGRFNRLDPFAGNHLSPLSFHKYAYAHMNPIMGVDPTGLFYFFLMMPFYGMLLKSEALKTPIMFRIGGKVKGNHFVHLGSITEKYTEASLRLFQTVNHSLCINSQIQAGKRKIDLEVILGNIEALIEVKYCIPDDESSPAGATKETQWKRMIGQIDAMLAHYPNRQAVLFTVIVNAIYSSDIIVYKSFWKATRPIS